MVHFGSEPGVEMVVHFEGLSGRGRYCLTVLRCRPSSRAMRRIDQPSATNLEIASCSCTLSMLAIVAAHTPVSPDYFAALWPPARWYTLKPFISTRPGTLSLTADNRRSDSSKTSNWHPMGDKFESEPDTLQNITLEDLDFKIIIGQNFGK